MNPTDLHSLLTAAPVSRTVFFTQMLMESRPQSEISFEDPATDGAAEPVAQMAAPAQFSAGGFSA